MLDARHPNTNPDQSLDSSALEPLATQVARANKKYKPAIDLMYAYAHDTLDDETIKLTGFSSGDNLFAFIGRFYGLKGLPNFFIQQGSLFLKVLIHEVSALIYIDDILVKSNSKPQLLQLTE